MIRRSRDPELVNGLAGLDLSEFLAEPLNVCLVHEESGALFAWRGPGTYEAHVFFAARGREAVSLGRIMLDIMRREHGARHFWALIPLESRKVRLFTRWIGWRSKGVLETRHGMNELFVSGECECLQPL